MKVKCNIKGKRVKKCNIKKREKELEREKLHEEKERKIKKEFERAIQYCRETKGAYALEVEARDGAPSARPNSGGQPNSGRISLSSLHWSYSGP